MAFESEVTLQAHIRSRACDSVDSPFEEKMTHDQLTTVKRRAIGQDPSNAWYDIFKILFPGAPLPLSPYPCVTFKDFWPFSILRHRGYRGEVTDRLLREGQALLDPQFLEDVWTGSNSILIRYLDNRVQQSSATSDD